MILKGCDMTRPLNSLTTSGQPGTASSATATDWASKLTANPAGDAAQSLQSDFSRWMERHTTVMPQTPSAMPQAAANTAKASAGQGSPATSLEARNALVRAQANAVQAKRQAQAPVAKAEAPKADTKPKSATPEAGKAPAHAQAKTDAAKGKAKEGTAKTAATDKATDAEKPDDAAADTPFVTAMGEGSAVVKELQAPDSIAPGDASAMLTWLASLTHGDAPAKGAGLEAPGQKPGSADELSANPLGMGTLLGPAGGHGDAPAGLAAMHDKGAAGAIDVSALQAVEGRLAALPEAADPSAKGLDFASTLSTEMMRGLASKPAEAQALGPKASDTLATPMGSPEFPQALAERVGMWVKGAGEDGTLSAELHLNPAEMGPISVKISLDGQSAQVDFAAATVETRRAIEESLPMLSAALDDAGLKLGGSGVSDQSPQQQFNQASGQPGGAPSWGSRLGVDSSAGDQVEGRLVVAPQPGRRGGLDLYA
jgi:flagellar hook-length control protein FliK